jgi:hypothetical protein
MHAAIGLTGIVDVDDVGSFVVSPPRGRFNWHVAAPGGDRVVTVWITP